MTQYNKLFYFITLILLTQSQLIFDSSRNNVPYDGVGNCTGYPNNLPLIDETPQLLKSVSHGQLFVVGSQNYTTYILELQGSSYEMGLAYGKLMKEQLKDILELFQVYLKQEIYNEYKEKLQQLPDYLQGLALDGLLFIQNRLLDLDNLVTYIYTPKRFNDEMRGIADGAEISYHALKRLNILPEYIKAGCSLAGAWGDATSNKKLSQLRALDWDRKAAMLKYQSVVIYKSTEKGSYIFSNIGYIGLIGTITGYSETSVGISEKLRNKDTNTTRYGTPWIYVLRDVLQFSKTLDDGLKIIHDAHRTCSIWVGLGASMENTFRAIAYSHTEDIVYNDKNYPFTPMHPEIKDVVFVQYHEETNMCFTNLFQNNYGQVNAQFMYQYLSAMLKTGDTQVVTMDFENNIVYVASSNIYTGEDAYNRRFTKINLNQFFKH